MVSKDSFKFGVKCYLSISQRWVETQFTLFSINTADDKLLVELNNISRRSRIQYFKMKYLFIFTTPVLYLQEIVLQFPLAFVQHKMIPQSFFSSQILKIYITIYLQWLNFRYAINNSKVFRTKHPAWKEHAEKLLTTDFIVPCKFLSFPPNISFDLFECLWVGIRIHSRLQKSPQIEITGVISRSRL